MGRLSEACVAVRMAQIGLNGDCLRAGTLVEDEALGEGSFGVVKSARHSVLPGSFAVKMLKEVRLHFSCCISCVQVNQPPLFTGCRGRGEHANSESSRRGTNG